MAATPTPHTKKNSKLVHDARFAPRHAGQIHAPLPGDHAAVTQRDHFVGQIRQLAVA
jgi:hypothetical protein